MANEYYNEVLSVIDKIDVGNISSAELAQHLVDALIATSASLSDDGHRQLHSSILCWDDLQCPPEAFNAQGSPSPPTIDNTTVPGTWLFSGTIENNLAVVRQMPHRWKQGGTLKPHVHWEKTTTGSGEVMWQWCYSIANVGAVFPAYSDYFDGTNAVPHSDTVRKHALDTFPEVDMTGKRESCMICIKFRRLPSHASDTYAADARFLEFDIHYQSDKDGTEVEYPEITGT